MAPKPTTGTGQLPEPWVWEAAGQAGKGARMAEGPYLMGIDLGTGGVRVGLFDRQGSPAVFHAVELTTRHPRPGRAEQDPGEWWSALAKATRGALSESGVPAAEIAGISVDATASTVVATDADGRHLRPAIMWMDVRAADQARRVQETGDPALKYNGFGAVSAEPGRPVRGHRGRGPARQDPPAGARPGRARRPAHNRGRRRAWTRGGHAGRRG